MCSNSLCSFGEARAFVELGGGPTLPNAAAGVSWCASAISASYADQTDDLRRIERTEDWLDKASEFATLRSSRV